MSKEIREMIDKVRNFDLITESEQISNENPLELDDLLGLVNKTEDIPELYELIDKISDVIFDFDEEDKNKSDINKKIVNGDIDEEEGLAIFKEFKRKRYEKFYEIKDSVLKKIMKIEEDIMFRIKKMYSDLKVKKKSYPWGSSPMDDELGRPFGDERGVIFLKTHEDVFAGEDGEETYYDGVDVELVAVKKEYRGTGVARELLNRLTQSADNFNVKLYIQIVPLEKDVIFQRLIKFYEYFGFVFDGIKGYRQPKQK